MSEVQPQQGMSGWLKGCLAIFIVVALLAVWGGVTVYEKFVKPAIGMAQGMKVEMQKIQSTSEEAAVRAAGETISVAELEANAAGRQGQWVSVRGKVSSIKTQPQQRQGGTTIQLGPGTLAMLAGVQPPATVNTGDEVVVVGIVSGAMASFMAKLMPRSSQSRGGSRPQVVFLLAKTVKPVTPSKAGGSRPKAQEAAP